MPASKPIDVHGTIPKIKINSVPYIDVSKLFIYDIYLHHLHVLTIRMCCYKLSRTEGNSGLRWCGRITSKEHRFWKRNGGQKDETKRSMDVGSAGIVPSFNGP